MRVFRFAKIGAFSTLSFSKGGADLVSDRLQYLVSKGAILRKGYADLSFLFDLEIHLTSPLIRQRLTTKFW